MAHLVLEHKQVVVCGGRCAGSLLQQVGVQLGHVNCVDCLSFFREPGEMGLG